MDPISRRKFLQYSLASGTFSVALGTAYSPGANAFLPFLLGSFLKNAVIRMLIQGAFSAIRNRGGQDPEFFVDRMNVQLAQREFLSRQFTNIDVTQTQNNQYGYIIAGQSLERLGHNVALGFANQRGDGLATFSGASSLGMAVAAQYLQENERMSYQEVQAAILPRQLQYNNWQDWTTPTSFVAYANIASQDGVLIRYDAVNPRPGGHGIISVTVSASRRIRVPEIVVQYI
jgi:hypothetical protein